MKTISTIQKVMGTVCRIRVIPIRSLLIAGWLLLGTLGFVQAQTGDYGDAPVSYEQGNPARHTNGPGFLAMGSSNPDVEGGPNSVAAGASCNASAGDGLDEDAFLKSNLTGGTTNLPDINIARSTYRVYVRANRNGSLSPASVCGWIDFNRNGIFDANERACATVANASYNDPNTSTSAGLWQLEWTLPPGTQKGLTYARFRLAFDSETGGNMQPTGPYVYGEVEDYSLNTVDLADNINCGIGFSLKPVDVIAQRQIDTYTSCPNYSGATTINFATGWQDQVGSGQMLVMDRLNCFSHLPGTGTWTNFNSAMPSGAEGSIGWLGIHSYVANVSGEGATANLVTPLALNKVFRGVFWATRTAGAGGAHLGTGYLKFYGVNDPSIGTIDNTLNASNSELLYQSPIISNTLIWNQYAYTFTPKKTWQYIRVEAGSSGSYPANSSYIYFDQFTLFECQAPDRGDAPGGYGDALHTIPASGTSGLYIGATAPDGDPVSFTANTATAQGDDLDNTDDEGGALTTICTTAGTYSTTINVVNSTSNAAARLIGWIDFNRNGVFDASEGVSVSTPSTGAYTLTWTGLTGLVAGQTYGRFRVTTDASVTTSTPAGLAADGEVEDWSGTIVNEGGTVTPSLTSLTTCSGDQVAINYTTTPAGSQVLWKVMPGGQTGSGNVLDFPVATGSTPVSYTYTAYIPSISGCVSNSAVTVVLVNPRPEPIPTVCSQTICSGQPGIIGFSSQVSGAIYHWTRTPITPGPSSGTGDISQTLINTGPTSITYTYRIWAESLPPSSCPSSTTITCTIVVTPGLTVTAFANSATVCTGSPLSLSAAVVPAAGNYTYSWTGPNNYVGTGANPTVTSGATIANSGNYTVVVTDAGGCSGTAVVPVTVGSCCPTPINRATVALCNNETLDLQPYVPAGGSFTLLTGATGSLSGSIFNGIVSGAGLFKVGYRASGVPASCAPDTITVIVRNCTLPRCNYPISSIVVDATCGNNDGRAELTIGGVPTNSITSFAWSNGQTGSVITGLSANVYSVTATVTDGATVCQVVDSVQVNNIGGPVAELRGVTPANCLVNGAASLSIVSGTGPFTVSWTDLNNQPQSQTGINLGAVNIANLPAGPYVFRISSAATPGCFGYLSVNIPRSDGGQINLIATATDAASCSSATGSIQITVQPQVGVSAPFSYSLDGQLLGSSSLPVYTISNLPAGVYTVAVSSANGCATAPQTVIINGTGAPAITGWSAQSPACPADQGKLIFAGGQPGTTFRVREATSGAVIASNINGANSTSLVVSAGTYIVQTTSGSCVSVDTLILNRPQDIDFNIQFTPETCAAGGVGNSDGSLSVVQIMGGTPPFSIVVKNSAGQTIPAADLNALPAGNYSVNVTDAHGCSGSNGTLVTVPPCGIVCPKLDFNTVVIDAQCGLSNGEATAQLLNIPTGPGIAVTYLWSNNAIGSTVFNLSSGVYSVTAQITSGNIYNGCKYVDSVNVNAIGGPVFTVSPLSPASCTAANGTAVINILSGTAPFTVSWTGQSSGSQTVPNLGSFTLNGLMAGNYVFTVTGAGATATCQGVYDIYLPGSSGNLAATVSTSAVTGCGATNGQIFVNVSGGVAPFTYIINGFVKGVTSARNFSVPGLPAGTYYVEVTDRNGCTTIRQNVLINTAGQPPIAGFTSTSPGCPQQDGTIVFDGTGVGSDTYLVTIAGTATQIGQTAGNVPASFTVSGGAYLITRTTTAGCVSTTVITITQPAGLDYNIQYTEPTCASPAAGSLSIIQQSGGTAPYSVTVLGASGVVSNLSTLTSGSYTVTQGDANGCLLSKVVSLTGGASFTVVATAVNPNVCIGTGVISLDATVSPAGSYTYSFAGPGNFTASNTTGTVSLSATSTSQSGTYTVVVTDVTGCSATATVAVTVTNCCDLVATAVPTAATSCVTSNGAITITYSGSNTYQYRLNGGANQALGTSPFVVNNLAPGSYSVVVSDVNSTTCLVSQVVVIDAPVLIVGAFSNSPVCASTTLALGANASGQPPYNYSWSGPNNFASIQQNPTILNVTVAASGTYQVIVTDAGGCSATATTVVAIATTPSLTVTASPSLTVCSGQSASLVVTGDNGLPIVWRNNFNQSGSGLIIPVLFTNAGTLPTQVTYTIDVGVGDCRDSKTVVVTINPAPQIQVVPSAAVYCDIEQVKLMANAFPANSLINWNRTPATPNPPAITGSGTGSVTINQSLPAGNYNFGFTATNPATGCVSQPVNVPVIVQP